MNKEKKSAGHKVSRIALLVVLLAGIAAAVLYPFDNRNLSIHFIAEDAEYVVNANNLEIAEETCKEIEFNESA